jgi:precorrin-6A/cobalt-precorrin-6A reductase
MSKTVLLLGGTAEAIAMYNQLVKTNPDWRIIYSLAGRTQSPETVDGEINIGGFGGIQGLVQYLDENKIDKLIDVTHPFAMNISQNAKDACQICNVPYEAVLRSEWLQQAGDSWIEVETINEAANTLPQNAKPFLALGRQYLSAFDHRTDCDFVVRMVDAPTEKPSLAQHQIILGKPSNQAQEELTLLRHHNITHLVSRNSGGSRSYAKIEAARMGQIPVIMIRQPKLTP